MGGWHDPGQLLGRLDLWQKERVGGCSCAGGQGFSQRLEDDLVAILLVFPYLDEVMQSARSLQFLFGCCASEQFGESV